MRVVTLDSNNKVVGVKNVTENYVLQQNEMVSETGNIGQVLLLDGTFVDPEPEPVEHMPTIEEMTIRTLLNIEYLVILSEIDHLGA